MACARGVIRWRQRLNLIGRRKFSSSGSRTAAWGKYVGYGGCAVGLVYAGGVVSDWFPTPSALAITLLNTREARALEDGELAQSSVTDRVFLKVQIGDEILPEPIVLALYGVECQRTVNNFKALCASQSAAMGYRGVRVHRIIPGFMMQSGDFTRGDGSGGTSIYGGPFADESFAHKHVGAGVLSMANRGPNTNTSQFFITFKSTPWLDDRHVVFGRVVSGLDVVRRVEAAGTRSGRPRTSVRVVDCGCLERTKEEALNATRAAASSLSRAGDVKQGPGCRP